MQPSSKSGSTASASSNWRERRAPLGLRRVLGGMGIFGSNRSRPCARSRFGPLDNPPRPCASRGSLRLRLEDMPHLRQHSHKRAGALVCSSGPPSPWDKPCPTSLMMQHRDDADLHEVEAPRGLTHSLNNLGEDRSFSRKKIADHPVHVAMARCGQAGTN